jgi:hypothetical protein
MNSPFSFSSTSRFSLPPWFVSYCAHSSLSALVCEFGCGRDRVTQALLRGVKPPEARGRHLALADDAGREILTCIETQAAKSIAMTLRNIRKHIVTFQDTPSLREQLEKCGACLSIDFVLKSRAKLYINAEIFAEYICTVFLPVSMSCKLLKNLHMKKPYC